jgi:hypothetical protein
VISFIPFFQAILVARGRTRKPPAEDKWTLMARLIEEIGE